MTIITLEIVQRDWHLNYTTFLSRLFMHLKLIYLEFKYSVTLQKKKIVIFE